MALLFIGLLVFVGSYFASSPNPALKNLPRNLKFVGLALATVGFFLSAVVQVNSGEVGVTSLFGDVEEGTLSSGLHVINPLLETHRFNIRTQNYTMSGVHSEGTVEGDDAIRVLSKDGLEVVIDLTVLYKINPAQAPSILRTIGENYEEVIVRPIARTRTRDVAVYYDAVSLFSSKRDEFQAKITKDIEQNFKSRGLILEQLLVRNIQLPAAVKTSIEAKISAEQEAQKMQFVLQKERQEADRKRVEAQGIADYQKIVTSSLNKEMLQYEMIKAQLELAKSSNAKMVIMDGKNVPIMLDGK